MKKNGFTLIEIIISLVLLSFLLLFLMKFLLLVRGREASVNLETKEQVNKAIISKTINEDIRNNEGISTLNCINNECNITLNNDETRSIQVIDGSLLTYTDTTEGKNTKLFSKKAIDGVIYELEDNSTDTIYLITIINVNLEDYFEEYNVEIVSKKEE